MDRETMEEQKEKLLEERDFVDDSLNEMDLDSYTTKKTLAEGLLDMTILTRNATLLRELIRNGRDKSLFYDLLIVLIPIALTFQVSPDSSWNYKNVSKKLNIFKVANGILFLILGKWKFDKNLNKSTLEKLNNVTVTIVFITTILNTIITIFSISDLDSTKNEL